jgi:hypothetical protein
MRDGLLPLCLNEFPGSLQQFFKLTIREAAFNRVRLTYGSHNVVPHLALHALREETGAKGHSPYLQVAHQIVSNGESL